MFLNLKKKKKIMKNFTTRRQLPNLLLLTLSAKFLTERKYLLKINLIEAKISLDEIIKSINSKTNNKFSGNYVFTAEFYKHFHDN